MLDFKRQVDGANLAAMKRRLYAMRMRGGLTRAALSERVLPIAVKLLLVLEARPERGRGVAVQRRVRGVNAFI